MEGDERGNKGRRPDNVQWGHKFKEWPGNRVFSRAVVLLGIEGNHPLGAVTGQRLRLVPNSTDDGGKDLGGVQSGLVL